MKCGSYIWRKVRAALIAVAAGMLFMTGSAAGDDPAGDVHSFRKTVTQLAGFGDRSTGTAGAKQATGYIRDRLAEMGYDNVGRNPYALPVLRHDHSVLTLPDRSEPIAVTPLIANAVSPGTIAQPGISGPLVYVKNGTLADLNGRPITGAIVMMEMNSGHNWANVAALGAKALIYIAREARSKFFFEEKLELSPVSFPRFWMSLSEARELFGDFESMAEGVVLPDVRLQSRIQWESVEAENIHCLIPGTHPDLSEQLIVAEAFYDSTAMVPGRSPGAGEAISIATLLELARWFKEHPPDRSILLVATSGHAQNLAGMREFVWSYASRSKDMRDERRRLRSVIKEGKKRYEILDRFPEVAGAGALSEAGGALLKTALSDEIKNEVDRISRRLMQMRLEETEARDDTIREMTDLRLRLRQLDWQTQFTNLSSEETGLLSRLVPQAKAAYEIQIKSAGEQLTQLEWAMKLRSLIKSKELVAGISLHLSSHGDGVGAFNEGWMYPLKSIINRVNAYIQLDQVLRQTAPAVSAQLGLPPLYRDTLRPSPNRSWKSYFLDKPAMGGEITSVSGVVGITLATTHDARQWWGTPHDTPDRIQWDYAESQSRFVSGLVHEIQKAPRLRTDEKPRFGFGNITGRAKFLRHGELFADQPAPGSLILTYQGDRRYYTMVDSSGLFQVKGIADKKHVLHKGIIEGYRFDPDSGEVIWAIDKKQTGKQAYRVKMDRTNMETDLVMFACRQTTLFNLLEPRSLRYMTKLELIDGRMEASPMRYWYSRIDTWASTLSSIYLEPGSRLKLTLSDNIIKKKLILTHADETRAEGTGYPVDDWPMIAPTEYRAASDMWALLGPRVANLEARGIYSERIHQLKVEGETALDNAETAWKDRQYERFYEASRRSWALAARVYDHVEKTQKDVLFGVLFYIALFIPFAFCMERFLFSYRNIYKRIAAFFTILAILVAVIYNVHPAFQLTYSPMVVVLAFFIMGLSVMVALIIFFRFEEEMVLLQRRSRQMRAEEVSRWKALTAAFFLGVGNLRRRRLRTILTCSTLIILTFTIMSFTSVKTLRHHARIQVRPETPYQGFLLKNMGLLAWQDMAAQAQEVLSTNFVGRGTTAPRVWLEAENKSNSVRIPIRNGDRRFEALGVVGLAATEPRVTGLDGMLSGGRWFDTDDGYKVLLPQRAADALGIDPGGPGEKTVSLWGMPFEVAGVFPGTALQSFTDLDGEVITPITFPNESAMVVSDVEMEAIESGEDIQAFQSRYEHVPAELTIIVPYRTLMAMGGRLKSMAVGVPPDTPLQATARLLADRFSLAVFSGEGNGTYVYNVSDTLSYSGVPNILIPLVISILIVLNTMIGSVYERKHEIGIYTSVGLAPSHVSFLFIAEALSFAILSVVLGYIMAQTAAKFLSATALWSGITVNYSSLAGVAAMILVILVVLISVIYPSRVAARIAIPDVKKSWTMPAVNGNYMELTLPFLMKEGEDKSVGGYLWEYFTGHQDVSHGLFSTGDLSSQYVAHPLPATSTAGEQKESDECRTRDCLEIRSRVWLAPFDLGIMQYVRFSICDACNDPGFMEIRVSLTRESGEVNAWRRINRVFIHQLRKQLLVWRSLDDADKRHYARVVEPAAVSTATSKTSAERQSA